MAPAPTGINRDGQFSLNPGAAPHRVEPGRFISDANVDPNDTFLRERILRTAVGVLMWQ